MNKIITTYYGCPPHFEVWINPYKCNILEAEGKTETQALKNLSRAIKSKTKDHTQEINRLKKDLKLVQNKLQSMG